MLVVRMFGVVCLLVGGYAVVRPASTRNWLPGVDRRFAGTEASQRYARVTGVFTAGIGLLLLVTGAAPV